MVNYHYSVRHISLKTSLVSWHYYIVVIMPWKRPADVPLGTVWRRFEGRTRKDGTKHNYLIRDVLPSDIEKGINLMTEAFLRDEPLCHALGIPSDPPSVETIQNNWRNYLSQQVGLICYTVDEEGNEGELVAINICLVKSKDDPEDDLDKVVGVSWKKLLITLIAAEATCDVFDKYGVDCYLTSSGLTVVPEHRGQNIGAEMFKARGPLCAALGVRATATVFTATTSQVLAAKCGYQLLGELPYSDMLEFGIDLTASDTPTAKLMGTVFQ